MWSIRTHLVILISFLLLCLPAFSAESDLSRKSFFQQKVLSDGKAPYPFSALQDRLLGLIKERPLPDPLEEPDLIVSMIPFGRSLHAPSTDFAKPRIVFGYVPSAYIEDRRPYYKDLADRLFVTYSERQNTLEVISWNRFEGRFNFESIRNYIPAQGEKQIFVTENDIVVNNGTQRKLCMTCHQAGGPIYSDKPWAESNIGFNGDLRKKSPISIEIEKAVGQSTYLGLPIDPVDALGNRQSFAGRIERVVRDAHSSLLNGRRMAKQVCADNLACRETYLKSVLQLANARYYEKPINVSLLVPKRDLMKPFLREFWPSHLFAYANPTIPNRNPLLKTNDPIDPKTNPSTARAKIRGLALTNENSYDVAASDILNRALEGFGFDFADLPLIQKCKPNQLEGFFASPEFAAIVRDWNLNDTDTDVQVFKPLYEQVLESLRNRCF